MAPATYNITTSQTDLQGLWRKVQGKLMVAANFVFPEWDDLEEFSEFDVDWSAREITAPFDLKEGSGVASIVEGGWEARPSTPGTVDASFTWIHLNKRFTVSKISKIIQQKNAGALLTSQFKYQGEKALQAIGQWIADSYYGFSTGVRAVVGAITAGAGTTTQTLTMKDAYGIAGLGSTTAPFFVSQLYRVDEFVAFIRAGALVASAIGQITTVDVTVPNMIVSFAVAPTLAVNDQMVFANSLENTTLAGTDYNKSLTGFLDAVTSVSLEGISSATFPKWKPGYADTAVGRWGTGNLRRMKQAINNTGGGTLKKIRYSQGVENDLVNQLQPGLHFTDAFKLEVDGAPSVRGVDVRADRHVPPGYVFAWDTAALKKMVLLPKPGTPAWSDGEKIPDRSAFVFPVDYPCQMVWINRGNLAYSSNKAEQ